MQQSYLPRAVVLAGDYSYIRQIETTLKSLIYHNSHLKIYIFNQDIPHEWFVHHRHLLSQIDSELVDVKLLDVGLDENWGLNHNLAHINYMTFARFFIPRYVFEDMVLYLDSDIVVTQDISHLWDLDLTGYYLAGVEAVFGIGFGFNAGVLLINNKLWREENLTDQLIDLTNQKHDQVPEGDQTILNDFVGEAYLRLEDTYNYHIGYDHGADYYGHRYLFEIPLDPLPAIVHYVSADKPWKTYSKSRLRELWWQYHLMDWSEIFDKCQSIYQPKVFKKRPKILTLTDTCDLLHLEVLAQACPDWEFHIAAFTAMAPELMRLSAYDNIVLHPGVVGMVLEYMIKNCQAYLDIDQAEKDSYYLNLVKDAHKPVFSFDQTLADEFAGYEHLHLFFADEPMMLAHALSEMNNS